MNSVWLIGLALPAALLVGAAAAVAWRHRYQVSIALGAAAGSTFALVAWSLARRFVADPTRVAEPLFLQLSIAPLACFVFGVVAMVGARWLKR